MISKLGFGVFIGEDTDVKPELLKQHKIGMTLDLTGLNIDVRIDDNTIKEVENAVSELNRMWKTGHNVLVYCQGGIDRAPFVVALWLSRNFNRTFQSAYYKVKKCRPQTLEHWDWYKHFTGPPT